MPALDLLDEAGLHQAAEPVGGIDAASQLVLGAKMQAQLLEKLGEAKGRKGALNVVDKVARAPVSTPSTELLAQLRSGLKSGAAMAERRDDRKKSGDAGLPAWAQKRRAAEEDSLKEAVERDPHLGGRRTPRGQAGSSQNSSPRSGSGSHVASLSSSPAAASIPTKGGSGTPPLATEKPKKALPTATPPPPPPANQ